MTDHLPASSPLDLTPIPAPDPTHDGSTSPATPIPKKHDKVRSAWIAFAGRVVAQLVGAVATVILGYTVVSHTARTAATVATAKAESAAVADVAPPAREADAPPLARVQRAPGPALVVLPFADYSSTAGSTAAADGLTEAVTAALARSGRVHVTSRTSAMQYRQSTRPLPAIAAELGVDLVVEGSIVRQGDRARVTVQLIDAATDAHLWAQVYDGVARDLLAFEADISAAIDRDLAGVLPRGLQAPVPPTAAAASGEPVRSRSARTTF